LIVVIKREKSYLFYYANLNGNGFEFKRVDVRLPLMYRMLNSIELQEGVYKNELLDILASLFSIRTSNNIIMQLAISNAKEQLDKLKYPARIEDMKVDVR